MRVGWMLAARRAAQLALRQPIRHVVVAASALLDLLFFAIGGTAWGLPLIPLLKWAERN